MVERLILAETTALEIAKKNSAVSGKKIGKKSKDIRNGILVMERLKKQMFIFFCQSLAGLVESWQ